MALKLLLADESITIRKVVTNVFTKANYEVATVETHGEILKTTKRLQPDIVLISANMPGLDLKKDIKKIAGMTTTPGAIILLGQRGNGLDPEQSAKLGAGGFVYKPLDNRELQEAIQQVLQHPTKKSPVIKPGMTATGESMEARAEILTDLFESYFNENMVVITDTMTKALAPRIAADISSKVIESLEITELPKQIMMMTKGIVNDLVPQIAERVISREIESIKAEAIRLLEAEDNEDDDQV